MSIEKMITKPSSYIFYDDTVNMTTNVDILKDYDSYLNLLNKRDLVLEYKEVNRDYISNPIILNVQKYQKVKAKMLEMGLEIPSITNEGIQNSL